MKEVSPGNVTRGTEWGAADGLLNKDGQGGAIGV